MNTDIYLKPSSEKNFENMTKEEQDEQIDFELKELAHWLGGFDELRQRISMLEDNAAERAFERSQQD